MSTRGDPGSDDFNAGWAQRVAGTHINPKTLLATDYLNHFNEPIMLLGMVADVPEVLADLQAWRFKTYPEHFLSSNLDYGALAAEAYANVPPVYREAFDRIVAQLAEQIALAVAEVEACASSSDQHLLRLTLAPRTQTITSLADKTAAIIAGEPQRAAQDDIDKLFS